MSTCSLGASREACQDISAAGRHAGLEGDRSGLWFAFADAIRALRPGLVFIENVPGIFSKVGGRAGESAVGTVIADLAEAGYVGSWVCVRASDVGAPHQRERWFVLASDPGCERLDRWRGGDESNAPAGGEHGGPEPAGHPRAAAVAGGLGLARTGHARQAVSLPERGGGPAPDPGGDGLVRITPLDGENGRVDVEPGHDADRRDLGDARADDGHDRQPVAWGKYAPAVARWERIVGRRAPHPVDDRGRLNPPFSEWMMGYPAGWVTDIPVKRTHQLRMIGNSVCPQQAALAWNILSRQVLA